MVNFDHFSFQGTSVKGGSTNGVVKKPMCSQKYDVIKELFFERLSAFELGTTDKSTRLKRLNILLKSAINNISNKLKQSKSELQIDADISEC